MATNLSKSTVTPSTTSKDGNVLWDDSNMAWDDARASWDNAIPSPHNTDKGSVTITNLDKS